MRLSLKFLFVGLLLVFSRQTVLAQRFHLFSQEVKTNYPSVVYDFLERYLYEIDSLQKRKVSVYQRLRDDKVVFIKGTAATARKITPQTAFEVNKVDNKYYEAIWRDAYGTKILELSFPMQYELLLGKNKAQIEKEFKATLSRYSDFTPRAVPLENSVPQSDSCRMSPSVNHYYVTSVNTSSYYSPAEENPTFSSQDKWHSAANLFQECIADVSRYTLFIKQPLYGFKTMQYMVPLSQWLAYCQAMQLTVYFAVEEERADGLKALLIAQSSELGFNHMISLIIPNNFVESQECIIKGTLNAYIPIQNIKDLYQQYVRKPKKKI